eukprot:5152522-Pyramimonas_sp.AAC.1
MAAQFLYSSHQEFDLVPCQTLLGQVVVRRRFTRHAHLGFPIAFPLQQVVDLFLRNDEKVPVAQHALALEQRNGLGPLHERSAVAAFIEHP